MREPVATLVPPFSTSHLEAAELYSSTGAESSLTKGAEPFTMEAAAVRILIGLVVGTLIGLTGLGGGVLLLPILIFGLGVPAIKAVGSDALFNFVTKIPSSIVHLSKGTVRRKVVLALAAGSVPGS